VETLAEAGRLLGRINRAFDKLTLVDSATKTVSDAFHRYDTSVLIPGKRYHQWDGKHTADLESFVQHIPDQKRRSLVESVLDAFQRDILDTGIDKKFRTGALHGDFNDANILVDEDLNATGVIDFGDSIIR
jgi:Ser/Thr protein kinase RdoA (MazF antagonist)